MQRAKQRIGDWDVSRVTNFTQAFMNRAEFNADLSRWNTSSAKSFDSMFKNATAFNGDVSKWKTESEATKDEMFHGAVAFKSKYMCAKYTDAPEDLSSCADVLAEWIAPSPPPGAPQPPPESPPPKLSKLIISPPPPVYMPPPSPPAPPPLPPLDLFFSFSSRFVGITGWRKGSLHFRLWFYFKDPTDLDLYFLSSAQ